jgi:phenylacetate-CoA ligase
MGSCVEPVVDSAASSEQTVRAMRPQDVLFLRHLMANQWQSPQKLQELQDSKLVRLLRHSYERVPYYRRLFDSVRVKPEDIKGVKDLTRLPLTSKEELRDLPQRDILARGCDPRRCRKAVTSGSTGIPLTILYRRQDLTRINLAWGRTYFVHGVKPWHRMATFTGQRDAPKDRSWYEYLGLMQRKVLSTWDHPDRWISELGAWQPHALSGYVMTLRLLGRAMQAQKTTGITPNVVFQTSGLLDEPSRRFLRSVFGVRIVDVFGSHEGGCIAWECATCAGYHINADMVVVEIVDGGRLVPPGEEGEIVVTNLHSYAMPFIRYRQGDVGRLAQESPQCGRGLPLMKIIEGRLGDFIVLPSGKRLSPHPFFVALDTTAGITRWQLVQETPHRLHVKVVVAHGFSGHGSQAARASLQAIVGEDMEVIVSEVDAIPHDPAQKFRSVRSMLDQETA